METKDILLKIKPSKYQRIIEGKKETTITLKDWRLHHESIEEEVTWLENRLMCTPEGAELLFIVSRIKLAKHKRDAVSEYEIINSNEK